MSAHPLYTAALQADEHYAEVLRAYGLSRWAAHSPYLPVKHAYEQKVEADRVWLDFMRAASLARSSKR